MTNANLKILCNIIGGVESGGQVYGRRDYSAYAPAYANSPNEHTCTLGWAQQYGANARKLVKKIYNKNKSVFRKADTANIESKLSEDWEATRWNPSSAEKKALIAIISTDVGKKCQDDMFIESAKSTIKNANAIGCASPGSRMMYVEIAHLGGESAAKRIFSKMSKPFTVDKIFSTLMLDQNESNQNLVGSKIYQSRHECCVKWIKKYVKKYDGSASSNSGTSSSKNEQSESQQDKIINLALSYVGVKESPPNSNNVIFNTHYYGGEVNDPNLAWCCAFVWDIFRMAGLSHLFYGGKKTAYCPTVYDWALNNNLVVDKSKATYGDIVLFDWDGDKVADHIGFVISLKNGAYSTVEGNTSNGNNSNGGEVMVRERYASSILAIIRPKYGTVSSISAPPQQNTNNQTGVLSNSIKWNGIVDTGDDTLNVRTWAGTEYEICSFSPLADGAIVGVCDSARASDGSTWYFICYEGKYGFVHSDYIRK